MTHKIALAAASAAAAFTLAAALAVAGFAPGPAQPVSLTSTIVDPTAEPTVQVDTVYVAPPPKQETITVHKVIKTAGGEGENESGGDD